MGRGNFEGGKGRPIVKCSAVICAKTAEPIEMPLGLCAGWAVGIMLHGGPGVSRDNTTETDLRQTAIN